jgi:hypothetical protein
MPKICRRIVSLATAGIYELHVHLEDSTSTTVLGDRSVNGNPVETWTNSQLLKSSPQTFTVAPGENHRVTVFATFVDGQGKAIVDLKRQGETDALRTCVLQRGAETVSSMTVLA